MGGHGCCRAVLSGHASEDRRGPLRLPRGALCDAPGWRLDLHAEDQLSVLRALSPSTPVVLCPAMNTMMYSHPLTTDHLEVVQRKLGYMVSGPQGAGLLACGDEGGL